MRFVPTKSRTEAIVDPRAGYMEFDLTSALGYQEFRGMFAELGVKAALFNGYMVQSGTEDTRISTTPVQFHLFEHSMYLAPPFEAKSYYFELPRTTARLSKVYFRIPLGFGSAALDGYKPPREDLYAVDIWTEDEHGTQAIYTLIYEAQIRTDGREYHIERFESEQLMG
ncbi:hypothetical protein [Alicyclobacillus ferrooxydans]|uniref:Uncharacterized protein n=1 Tax=Alicyclobacillus ferrooxydans TaxID=471514 RepID=A0A0P9EP55_9BACL|nr:hypothetical protein [Alicyclobacillus ferrooxydans]KPV45262.1 hypothetical protein AN477_02370 [Alicyclobacillus ferrooxydans]